MKLFHQCLWRQAFACGAIILTLGGIVVVSSEGATGPGSPPPMSWTHGNKTLLYILAQYSDQASPPTSRAAAEASLPQVSQFYAIHSYQQTSVSSAVTDPVILPQPVSYYVANGLGQLYTDAVAKARLAGWDGDLFDFVFIRHSGGPGGVGVGLVGEKGAWVQSDNWEVLAHELGHNYGLNHANAWRSSTSSPYGPGAIVQYGDPYDLMGPNVGSFSAYERSVLHWLPAESRQTITNGGIYRLHAFDVATLANNRSYALLVKKDTRDYWLDYRSQFQSGEAATFNLNGLGIRWPRWAQGGGGSTLIDTTPGTPPQFNDAPLLVGRTFSDAEAGVHITVLNRSPVAGEWLDVAVQFTEPAPNQNPTATMMVSATQVGVGESVAFSVTASDPEAGPLAYGWESSVAGDPAPLVVSSNSPLLSYSWQGSGRFEVRCRVSDTKGGVAIVSAMITVGVPTTYRLSGQVLDGTGLPVPDVRVYSLPTGVSGNDPAYVQNPAYRSALTDSAGRFHLLNLAAGTYAISGLPSATQTFAAVGNSGEVTVGPDVTNLQFLAVAKPTAIVSGFVQDGSRMVSNVVVQLGSRTTTSRMDGSFSFSNVPPASYVLSSPDAGEYLHSDNPLYVDGISLTNQNLHRVLYPVRGTVPFSGALVYVGTGEPGRSVLALPDPNNFLGDWIYELQVPKGTWNLEALATGYTYAPTTFSNPIIVGGAATTSLSNLNFTVSVGTTYAIRGRVTLEGKPLVGVTTSIAGRTGVTDSLGSYALSGLSPGPYTVSASLAGYIFSTSGFSNPVTVGPDAASIDFLAFPTATTPSIVTHPQSQVINLGATATFSVTAAGSPPLAYQWYFNNSIPLPGATNSSLSIMNVSDSNGGLYSVAVSNGASVTSSNALLTVNHPPVPAAPVLERFAQQAVKLRIADFLGSDPDGDALFLYSVGPTSPNGATITTNDLWVIYSPPPGFTNSDSFPFIVRDGRGGQSAGTATVTVKADDGTPQNLRIEQLGNGSVRLIFDGIADRTYSVQFTEDLDSESWDTLGTVTANEHGVFVYVDAPPIGSGQRFYRAAWP